MVAPVLLVWLALAPVTGADLRAWSGSPPPQRRSRPGAPVRSVPVRRRAGALWIERAPSGGGFGLSPGTWIAVRLTHAVASGDPGWVSLRTRRPASGVARTLPRGTLIFATKRFSVSGARLQCQVVEAVIGGHAVAMHGQVFDGQRRMGFPAWVKRARSSAGTWRDLIGALGQATGHDILKGTPRGLLAQGQTAVEGYASPQDGWVQLTEEF